MSSSKVFFALLTLIVISQGALKLNEQFIVAGCFIAFSYVAYVKIGSIVSEALETRGRELVTEQLASIKALEESLSVVNQIQQQRIEFSKRISTIGLLFEDQTKKYIEMRQKELEMKILDQVLSPLEDIAPKEQQLRTALEKGSIQNSIQTLINQYHNDITTNKLTTLKKFKITKQKKA